MKLLIIVGLLGAVVLGVSASIEASTLFTPPLPGGGAGVFCQVVNVAAAPRDVTISIFDSTGDMVNQTTCTALAFSNACSLAVPGAGVSPHFCRVDVEGGKATVRASIVRSTSDGVPAVALPAE